MKLQTSSMLALYAVLELASDPKRQLSAADIAQTYGISIHHLSKVLHTLGRAGLVRSVRGAGGGYMFIGNAKRTTLLDVVTLFEPVDSWVGGEDHTVSGTSAGLMLASVLGEINEIAVATLNSITISTALKQMQEGEAPPVLAAG